MSSIVAWDRLVRYVGTDGVEGYGEPQLPDSSEDILQLAEAGKLQVRVLEGNNAISAKPTNQTAEVARLLSPLQASEVDYIRCIGLNYKTHSKHFRTSSDSLVCRDISLTYHLNSSRDWASTPHLSHK